MLSLPFERTTEISPEFDAGFDVLEKRRLDTMRLWARGLNRSSSPTSGARPVPPPEPDFQN